MYVHASPSLSFSLGDTSLPAPVRGSRGRPQRDPAPRKYRSRTVSVLPVSSPNYSEPPANSSGNDFRRFDGMHGSLRSSFYTAPCTDFPISLARKFLGWRKNFGWRKFQHLLDIVRCSKNSPRTTPYAVVPATFRGIKEATCRGFNWISIIREMKIIWKIYLFRILRTIASSRIKHVICSYLDHRAFDDVFNFNSLMKNDGDE